MFDSLYVKPNRRRSGDDLTRFPLIQNSSFTCIIKPELVMEHYVLVNNLFKTKVLEADHEYPCTRVHQCSEV